ncbi:hypothetical protein TBLA_0B05140 [Henningerozyma blattae CBS 6284]|uniref:Uncharacterized protein n=1 Tax=Henningerozyma blattae (strain ATCC 34711 / CBS 6284 / DSM 70876 / NBRC 10599 / NRRL Y-10934 / UCD 77-7) TaxID=1071380 RepID=I2GYZ5_HENB6|nr:hypothetical protein TBLA_0B05140 [Tetrapisispora blattae CBS 6284]CCH59347.1 hypothetical protein TBLA_0B05140 [Tetrapisispora blattae CBS 6284]
MSSLIHAIRDFISVESLDSRVLPKAALHKRLVSSSSSSSSSLKSYKKGRNNEDIGELNHTGNLNVTGTKPLWNTLEFKFYYIMFLIVVPWMILTTMSASNETNQNYYRFERLLSQGWLFGRKVDNSDAQYRFFRDNLVLLSALGIAHVTIKRSVITFTNLSKLTFDLIFGLIFIFAAHGVNSIRIFLHMFILFGISHIFRGQKQFATILLWIYGVGSIFINAKYRTYPFSNFLGILSPLDTGYKGIIERWDVFFNFTLLRLLSYNLDYLERWDNILKDKGGILSNEIESKEMLESKVDYLTERSRLVAPLNIQTYNVYNYVAYSIYTPLFIAGPIITFNDYIYQTLQTLPSINRKRIVSYAIKLVIAILTMEFILHFAYVVAVSKTKAWEGNTPFQNSMIGLVNLNIIWLKLMIPWRLFRLWAMCDQIDTPENMIRCVDNNYSALAFWRAWHRSYNKWVIRYIYIPLGGSKNRILSSLAVFTFVAIWHDVELKLLLWGWLIVLFLLPEMFATQYFAKYRSKPWYRHFCALGAVLNIWLMMIANLFGFCLGADGTAKLLRDMFSSLSGFVFFIASTGCLFIAVQIMFEQREEEKRRGINLKC